MTRDVKTYEPDNSLKHGYFSIFGEISTELRKNRWLTYQLARRDLFSIYKQSLIGFLWIVILPLISVATFIVLNHSGIFRIGEMNVPYPIYAILGMAFWQLFSTGLVACSNSLVHAGSMILKINLSKESLVIASAGKSIISFLVQILLVAMLFIGFEFTPHLTILLIPIIILPIILLTLGLGFIFSLLNGIIRDIGNMVSILLTFLMFLTPVLYSRPKQGWLAIITAYNPFYYLVSFPRDLVLLGTAAEWKGFLITSILSLLIFVVCLVVFHMAEPRVTERI